MVQSETIRKGKVRARAEVVCCSRVVVLCVIAVVDIVFISTPRGIIIIIHYDNYIDGGIGGIVRGLLCHRTGEIVSERTSWPRRFL